MLVAGCYWQFASIGGASGAGGEFLVAGCWWLVTDGRLLVAEVLAEVLAELLAELLAQVLVEELLIASQDVKESDKDNIKMVGMGKIELVRCQRS